MADVEKQLIRYFCDVTDSYSIYRDTCADAAFDYFEALVKAGHPIRVFPFAPVIIDEGRSRWGIYQKNFHTPIPGKFLNVVCGGVATLNGYWTKGAKNIGILFSGDQEPELVRPYDLVVCLTQQEAIDFAERGVLALHLQPRELPEQIKGLSI